ncbi:hypothetical protein SM0020_06162 [Sinorhizobium meliloti CCNWSX0020]|uniref:Uncharacterized protein n=1 Tax=Sinorhizobium meliloti CCNWSX0020 TaxID=1107881 RepID=H0FVF9_RHIML|nr:hypothetical protein SM0020_06162 [Sinorhizobium meliloti CCNWSX0020]
MTSGCSGNVRAFDLAMGACLWPTEGLDRTATTFRQVVR